MNTTPGQERTAKSIYTSFSGLGRTSRVPFGHLLSFPTCWPVGKAVFKALPLQVIIQEHTCWRHSPRNRSLAPGYCCLVQVASDTGQGLKARVLCPRLPLLLLCSKDFFSCRFFFPVRLLE